MIVIASGYFDPLHVGHIEYLKKAKELAGNNGELFVIVNNDKQARLKKEKSFMNEDDRLQIVGALKCVDRVFLSRDEDSTVSKTLAYIRDGYSIWDMPMLFVKGGDRTIEDIPESELEICRKLGIYVVDGLGCKIRSSSELTGVANEGE